MNNISQTSRLSFDFLIKYKVINPRCYDSVPSILVGILKRRDRETRLNSREIK